MISASSPHHYPPHTVSLNCNNNPLICPHHANSPFTMMPECSSQKLYLILLGFPWLHRIKFKLLKEHKIFYEGSCPFSLPSTLTTLQLYQTMSVHNTMPVFKLQLCTLSGMIFPWFGTPSAHLLKPSSSHFLQKALTFPKIHSPHALTSLCTYLY